MGKGIERHITFHVLPEKVEEFGKLFQQEYRPATENTNGFVKAELLKDTEDHQGLKMVLCFESSDAAAGWRTSESHAALKSRLKPLYSGSELKFCEVIT